MLLREIGGELTLAQSAMDPERGVVLSEERLRDSPAYQSQKAQFAACSPASACRSAGRSG